MKYLVTGAGMLGSALAERLRAHAHTVVVFDREPAPDVVVGDLRDPATISPALEDVDGIFHTAAIHGWRENPPRDFLEVNVVGTWNLLEAAKEAGVTRIVHSSTIGVYGEAAHIEIGPDTPMGAETDVYNLTKRLAEQVARYWADRGLEIVCLRYGGFRQLIEHRFGSMPREWAGTGAVVDLADAVEANVRAMASLPTPRWGYVIVPTGGTDDSPYRVDASATEDDLGMHFKYPFSSWADMVDA